MFRASFSGKPLFDQATELSSSLQMGVMPPAFANCISFSNSAGEEPARGWLLMRRADLDALDLNALGSLAFELESEQTNTSQAITWNGLLVCKEPYSLAAGITANDPLAVYLVEVADSRWRVHNPYFHVAANKLYNVLSNSNGAGPTDYLAASLNSVVPWTWAEMIGDLWDLVSAQLGEFPGLPFEPDGAPTGWIFQGVSAWKAICSVLARIGCTVVADLTAAVGSQFDIVQIGANDTATDTLLASLESRKIHDGEFLSPTRFKLPAGVRVQFHKTQQAPSQIPPWMMSEPHTVDVAGEGGEAGVYHPIWDDLLAVYDGLTLTNSAELETRAAERAADYFRIATSGNGRLWKRYSGLTSMSPGKQILTVTWRLGGRGEGRSVGTTTEVVRYPGVCEQTADYADAGTVQDLVRLGFPASGGSGAPADADYLVKTANAGLPAGRVVTDTTHLTWDWSTAGQAKANVSGFLTSFSAIVSINDHAETSQTIGLIAEDLRTVFPLYDMPTITDVSAVPLYNGTTVYPVGAVVLYLSKYYRCITECYNVLPTSFGTWIEVTGDAVVALYIPLAGSGATAGLLTNGWNGVDYTEVQQIKGQKNFITMVLIDPSYSAQFLSNNIIGPINPFRPIGGGAVPAVSVNLYDNFLTNVQIHMQCTGYNFVNNTRTVLDLNDDIFGFAGDLELIKFDNVDIPTPTMVNPTFRISSPSGMVAGISATVAGLVFIAGWHVGGTFLAPTSGGGLGLNASTATAGQMPAADGVGGFAMGGKAHINAHWGDVTGNSWSSTVTLDASVTDKHAITLGGNTTIAISNDKDGQVLLIEIVQGGGGNTVTWPTGTKWSGGAPPTLSTGAGDIDVFNLMRRSSGNYYGFTAGIAFS